jgi:protein-S-isoprenylcysteine O-methyltransferase Ste14
MCVKELEMNLANRLIEFLVRRSAKEHNVLVRAITTLVGVTLFMAGIPTLVFWSGKFPYKAPILNHQVSQLVSIVCFIFGLPWMLSAVFLQLFRGKGTPVPIVPTKHFLQNGPYRYVRNPMMLGFFLYLLGWALFFNKVGAFLATAVIIAFLLVEIKIVEEPELEKRFGDAYREYKKETPFIFPKLRKMKQDESKGVTKT